MSVSLQTLQATAGAVFQDNIAVTYGNDQQALKAVQESVAIYDCSHWGRLQLAGGDRIRFLHNQSTNNFQILQPGQGCDTVFVTSTARTIDLATAYLLEEAILILVSPSRRQKIFQLLDRYIFPADNVELIDITEKTACFRLIGPNSDSILTQLGGTSFAEKIIATHQLMKLAKTDVRVAVGTGLNLPGYTLILPVESAANLWKAIHDAGVIPMGSNSWETLRIQQGRPNPDYELTDDYNPLEAGLWQTISFEKGCYIGQETIARLNTYKGVKQQLWGVILPAFVEPETPVMMGEEKIGKLTSITPTETGYFGLAYIRTKAGGEGLKVHLNGVEGEVVEVPFLQRGYLAETGE